MAQTELIVSQWTEATKATMKPRHATGTLWEAMRLFWSVTDSYAKRRLVFALGTVAGGAMLVAAAPVALKLIIDALGSHSAAVDGLAMPIALVAMYGVGQFLWRCSSELRVPLHGLAEQRVRRRMSIRIFDHLIRAPMRLHLERKVGAVGETVEQGLRGYELLQQHLIYSVVPVIVEFAVVSAVLVHFQQSKYLIVLALASLCYVAAFHRWAIRIYEPSERISRTHVESHAVLTDSLTNYETVKYFNAESVVSRRYDQALENRERAWRWFFVEYAINGVIVGAIFGLSLGGALAFGARDVISGAMTIGEFVLINTYVVRLVQPLETLGFAARDIAQGVAFLGSMLSLLRQDTEPGGASASTVASRCGDLAFENVSFSYNRQQPVLMNVSFSVPAGRTVAVVGVSGSGKSSLIRLLFRLYEPSSGRILLDGVPLAQLSPSLVRNSIAVVPQDTVLFHDTIGNNIGFGSEGASRTQIEEAARIANLHAAIIGMPEGYDTIVGDRGLKISGGERQRVAIARAALKRPKIFVFDEATSSLDTNTERDILKNLMHISTQSTTLIIAHRLSTVVHADQILVLHQGTIVERGTHQQLHRLGGYYAGLWDAQQAGSDDREKSGTVAIG
jgi:ABC-type transport system involved in Fe-S cluster assembly fused permease/ATPase subunit